MLNDLGLLYRAQNRDADAEPLMQRALAIYQKALQPDQIAIGVMLNNLAELYRVRGRYLEAEPFYSRAVSIFERALGPDHPDVGTTLNNLAALHFAQQDWGKAVTYLRRGTGVTVGRMRRGADAIGRAPTGKAVSEAARESLAFSVLVKAAHRLAGAGNADAAELAREMFRTSQWALGSEASASLAQMAARQAKGDNALARLVRERQDLVGEWQAKDKLLIVARTEPPARRNQGTESELTNALLPSTRVLLTSIVRSPRISQTTSHSLRLSRSVWSRPKHICRPTRPSFCSWLHPNGSRCRRRPSSGL